MKLKNKSNLLSSILMTFALSSNCSSSKEPSTITIPGTRDNEVTIFCHGYGDSGKAVHAIKTFYSFDHTLVGFNFPDHGITDADDHRTVSFGSLQELLPLLEILKKCQQNPLIKTINLYGFSAGGGAVINTLAILNTLRYEKELAAIGITRDLAQAILAKAQKGIIILECPLKSVHEIIATRGASKSFSLMAAQYDANQMNPIDTVQQLNGLNLTILLYLEREDNVLGNRDDALFIKRLQQANKGKNSIIIGSGIGHAGYHPKLWDEYGKLTKSKNV